MNNVIARSASRTAAIPFVFWMMIVGAIPAFASDTGPSVIQTKCISPKILETYKQFPCLERDLPAIPSRPGYWERGSWWGQFQSRIPQSRCKSAQYALSNCAEGSYCIIAPDIVSAPQCVTPAFVYPQATCGSPTSVNLKILANGKTTFVTETCPVATPDCIDGKCVPIGAVACSDSDKTNVAKSYDASILTAGQVTIGTKIHPDTCKAPQYLEEMACGSGGKLQMMGVNCGQLGGKCMGGACDLKGAPDQDKDGVVDALDNCVYIFNPDQTNSDGNGIGDVCKCATPVVVPAKPTFTPEKLKKCLAYVCDDPNSVSCTWPKWWVPENISGKGTVTDSDGDSIPDAIEECVTLTDPLKLDTDGDGWPDYLELRWQTTGIRAFSGGFYPAHMETSPVQTDTDGDGVLDDKDPCPLNSDKNCNPKACEKPLTPATECTAELMYSEPLAPKVADLDDVAWAAASPHVMAFGADFTKKKAVISQSGDAGKTWQTVEFDTSEFTTSYCSAPAAAARASMSADGKERRFWVACHVFESHDFGKTWTESIGINDWSTPTSKYSTNMLWVSPDGSVEYALGVFGFLAKHPLPSGKWVVLSQPGKGYPNLMEMIGDETGSALLLNGYTAPNQVLIIQPKIVIADYYDASMSLSGDAILVKDKIESKTVKLYYLPSVGAPWQTSTQADQILMNTVSKNVAVAPDGKTSYVMNFYGTLWQSKADPSGKTFFDAQWEPVFGRVVIEYPDFSFKVVHFNDIAVSPSGKEVMAVHNAGWDGNDYHNSISKITCP